MDLITGVVSAPVVHFSSYTIVKPAAAASINAFTGDAQSAGVGTAITAPISVRVLDASARPVPGTTVRFAVASGNGLLSGTTTATTNHLGVALLAGTWVLGASAGAQTLSASLTTGSVTAATIAATATAGAATRFVVSGTSTQVSGATQTVTITAKDAGGNTATSYAGAKSITMGGASTAPGGQKPTTAGTAFGTATTVTFSNGIATVPIVLATAETAKLTVSDGSISAATADQLTVTVTAGAATQLAIVRNIAGASSGLPFVTQPVVALQDANGNTAATNNGTVITMAVSAGGTLSGTTTATTIAGVASWSGGMLSGVPGSYTITFGSGTLTAATQSITLASSTPTQLVLMTIAAGAASGAPFVTQPVVAMKDASANTVTTATSLVTMTVSAGATIVGTATATALNGVAIFSTAGITGTAGTSYTLTFSASGLTSATQPITPTAGTATQLQLTTSAVGAVSGAAFTTQPVVAVKDAAGNTVTSASTVVTMTVSAGATIVGTATATAVNGVATFSAVGISGTAGTNYTLSFASSGLTSAVQTLSPTAGTATQLQLTTSAVGAVSGVAFTTQPVIAVKDATGNTVTSASTVVTMTVSAGATIVGTATATAVNGVATFSAVGISGTAGTSYALTFASAGLTSATQTILPTAGAATQLQLTTPAVGAASGAAFTTQPVVAVKDASGNSVTSATSVVTVTVSAGATIVGTNTATAVNGVATFSTVGITGTAGTSYTLTFAASGLTATTQSITGGVGRATQIAINAGNAQVATVGTAVGTLPSIVVKDAGNNTVTGVTVTFAVSTGGGSISGASAASNTSGIATVGSWVLGTMAGANTLTATSAGLAGSPLVFSATGVAGVAAHATLLDYETQVVTVGQPNPLRPGVIVSDAYGNPVPSLAVTFSIATGGGSVTGGSTSTDNSGIARLGSWTVGAAAGSNSISVAVPGFSTGTVTARAVAASAYPIDFLFDAGIPTSQQQIFIAAADRWRKVIVGAQSNVLISYPLNGCGGDSPAISQTTTGLVVVVHIKAIDGPGGVLATTGVCGWRSGSLLPDLAYMTYDVADFVGQVADGTALQTVTHELGHALGWGGATPWTNLRLRFGSADPVFKGTLSLAVFSANGGTTYSGEPVPLENTGGAGTAGAHWRESVMGRELMTGFLQSGQAKSPLSLTTLWSMADIGYTISTNGYDDYTVSSAQSIAEPQVPGTSSRDPFEILDLDGGMVRDEATGALVPIADWLKRPSVPSSALRSPMAIEKPLPLPSPILKKIP